MRSGWGTADVPRLSSTYMSGLMNLRPSPEHNNYTKNLHVETNPPSFRFLVLTRVGGRKAGDAREDFSWSGVPGDALINLNAIRAEAKAETPIHFGYGMTAGPRKSSSGVTSLTARILDARPIIRIQPCPTVD